MTPYSYRPGYTNVTRTDTAFPDQDTDATSPTSGPNTNKGPMMVKLNRAQRRKLMRLKRRSK